MKAKLSGSKINLKAAALGIIAALVVSLGLAAIASTMVSKGMLSTSAMGMVGCMITALAALAGAILCGGKADSARLPLCLAGSAVYLLLIFVLRGLFFRAVGPNLWAVPLCALGAAAIGAILTSGKKRRR